MTESRARLKGLGALASTNGAGYIISSLCCTGCSGCNVLTVSALHGVIVRKCLSYSKCKCLTNIAALTCLIVSLLCCTACVVLLILVLLYVLIVGMSEKISVSLAAGLTDCLFGTGCRAALMSESVAAYECLCFVVCLTSITRLVINRLVGTVCRTLKRGVDYVIAVSVCRKITTFKGLGSLCSSYAGLEVCSLFGTACSSAYVFIVFDLLIVGVCRVILFLIAACTVEPVIRSVGRILGLPIVSECLTGRKCLCSLCSAGT